MSYSKSIAIVYADLCAIKYSFYHQDQGTFAIQSYNRSKSVAKNGKFDNEIIPVSVLQHKNIPIIINTDEEFNNVNLKKTPQLYPVFFKEVTVTAVDASTLNNGGGTAALIIENQKYTLN